MTGPMEICFSRLLLMTMTWRPFRARRPGGRFPGLKPWAKNRGRDKGGLCPSLRTGQAYLMHPALQLVVSFREDQRAAAYACFKENKPTAEK
jgi:hypothetical protein